MTFTEAAVEVLRLVGKPLHYKKITEVAIERNMLSHVGKTPEVTMSSRLATMVKRDRGEAPIIKVKPGVFGLREFNEEQLADLSGDVDELPEVDVENEQDKPAASVEGSAEQPAATATNERRKPLPGADVFPEEDDDDEPILGGDDEEEDDDEAEGEEGARTDASASAESRSARRRRKRRRRGGEENEPAEARPAREPERAAREPREPREPREARGGRDSRRDERSRDRERNRDRERDRGERYAREDDRREREEPIDFHREPGDGDLLGKDLADAVASVLAQGGARGLSAIRIADLLVRKGRLAGEAFALVPTVMAAVRADIARKRVEQTRARFRLEQGAVVLTEFLLPQDVVRAEQEVVRAAERQRERARRAFVRKLSELPAAGMAELIATWLNAEGVVGLRAVRRPGAGVGELHLAGTLRRGADEVRLAIVVYREARELTRERVIEARGALHYYGNASTAWLLTFGTVTSGAREEASAPAAGPVALYDGLALATAMERQGVGVLTQSIQITTLDFELFESLRSSQTAREAPRERERERDHDRDRRGERTERGERDRPRWQDRRRNEEPVEAEASEEEVEEEVAIDDTDEVLEAVLQEAGQPATEGGAEQGADAREGSRRRRRRRRRRGRTADEAQQGGEAEAGEASEGSDEADEEREASWSEEREEGDDPEREPSRESFDDEERPRRYDLLPNDGDSLLPPDAEERRARAARDDDERDDEDARDDDEEREERDDDEDEQERQAQLDDEDSEEHGAREGDDAEPGQDEDGDDFGGRRGHG